MARLPTRQSLGGLPSARTGRPIATLNTSSVGAGERAIASGLQGAAQGLSQVGQAVANFQERRAVHERKVQAHNFDRQFKEFTFGEERALDEAQRSAEPGAQGFSDTFLSGHDERATAFLESLPEADRPKFESKLFDVKRGLFRTSQTFARKEEKRHSINGISDLTENVFKAEAQKTPSSDMDTVAGEFTKLVDSNPSLTPIERDELKRKGLRDIANAHLETLDPEDVDVLLETDPDEAPDIFKHLTNEDRLKAADEADAERKAILREIENEEGETRSELSKTGHDMLLADEMDADWLKANRDVLSASDYRTFLRALDPDSTRKTSPDEYLKFQDMVLADPDRAVTELRELYKNDQIAKADYLSLSRQAVKNRDGRSYEADLRNYVKRLLTPDRDAPPSHTARQLDAIFQFDDWIGKNPNADRNEMRKQADVIVRDFRQIRYASGITELPVPRFISKPRQELTVDDIEANKKNIVKALKAGELTQREAAGQAALMRRWLAILKDNQ